MTSKDKPRKAAAGFAGRGGKGAPRKPAPEKAKRAPKAAPAAGAPVAADEAVKPERISKLLARAGVASRRDIERMIMEGRVSLNGQVLDTPVVNATFADRIEVDGEPIRGIERTRLWLFHKPAGLVTTNSDPEGRPTVFDNLPEDLPRVMSIGRLDINTEGLLLLTNDGGLARVLELPTTGWLRRYRVRAHGDVDQPALDKLKEGIAVDGVLYGSIDATLDRKQGHNVWITMGLREGKNREIKNVLGALGLDVNRLIRISYGPFQLGDLPEGKVTEVRGRMLRDQLGPRLIEDAKANFDAPIYDRAAAEEEDEKPAKPAPRAREWGRDEREEARGRLDTRKNASAPRGDRRDKPKGGFRRDDRDDDRGGFADKPKRPMTQKNRTANVWMAPGARPVAEKKAAEGETVQGKPARRDGAGAGKRYGRDKDGKPIKSQTRFDPDRKGGFDDKGRRDEGPRVKVSRARDEDGEWIRAEAPARKPRDGEGGFGGGKRGFGDRPPRRDFGDRPERSDRPRTERGERPAYERGDRPRTDRPRGDKPFGDKPFGDKPRGGKSFGGKPAGKSFGGKPGGKPSGRPGGGKGFGGKPSGGGRGPGRNKG